MHPRAAELIRLLELRPHPEGGHFAEVFRSAHTVHPEGRAGARPFLTSIYFLLTAGEVSRWHRVLADEAWHHCEGDPLELMWLDEAGASCTRRLLGPAAAERRPLAVVPAGCWQAARPTGAYMLVGCSVGPGFDCRDFALLADHPAEAAWVAARFPDLATLI